MRRCKKISLVIVSMILAALVIASIIIVDKNNGIVINTGLLNNQTQVVEYREKLEMMIVMKQSSDIGTKITLEDIRELFINENDWIKNVEFEQQERQSLLDNNQILEVETIDGYIFEIIMENENVVVEYAGKSTFEKATVYLSTFPSGETNRLSVEIIVNAKSNKGGIATVKLDKTGEVRNCFGVKKVEERFEITQNQEYVVEVRTTQGRITREVIYINNISEYSIVDEDPPTKPTLNIISGTKRGDGWYTSDVEIIITEGNDVQDGVKETTYKIDGTQATSGEMKIENGGKINIVKDGINTITAWTYDKAGNPSDPEVMKIKKDSEGIVIND